MMPPRSGSVRYLLGGRFHTMHTTEHGDPAAPAVLCVHGLTRNGRDFDPLAQALSGRFRVIAPDLPGRGGSDWLEPAALYQPPSYVVALSYLLARLDGPLCYIGTSLGGICGMILAATPGTPLRRMVLNDIGPHIPAAALRRIRDYIVPPTFDDPAAAERHLRHIHAPFGKLTDAQWAALTRHSTRTLPNGRLTLHYDPTIAQSVLETEPVDADMWPIWDAIQTPMLTLRGETSDLLLEPTLARMAAKSQTLTVADTGHAPALMDAPTIASISDFLDAA